MRLSTCLPVTHYGKIPHGAKCVIDRCFFTWPYLPEKYHQPTFREDMEFTVERSGNSFDYWADGFGGGVLGRAGRYGNGCITVYEQPEPS